MKRRFFAVLLALFLAFGLSACGGASSSADGNQNATEYSESEDDLFDGSEEEALPDDDSDNESEASDVGGYQGDGLFCLVTRVVDGDTFVVDYNGTSEKVRIVGVDTPETVDPNTPDEAYGETASAFTKNSLEGQGVYLEQEPLQNDRDKYGRLLRHVFLEDGTNFGELLIRQGLAEDASYYGNTYAAQFAAAQDEAKASGRGMWG